ncbi:hypothetical protein MMC13_002361 [Lambiella insularis]|nr:hypothetical protein [Lambiella insularis]
MGIKGLYKELGPGRREALAKLAIEKLEETGSPLRIAVDISIWQFQVQSGKGGKNPALRTIYYRLLRFLALSIQPLFVFDGPYKPPFKRNVKTSSHGASLPNMLVRALLKKFGFPFLIAPGEAEAECALLQREGIVDAVLSEDVDTLMFGCNTHMKNWSREGKGKTPTHVNVYYSGVVKEEKGLDRESMILVALMSGGDYIPAGISNCGPKTACEAARAGFGRDLCKLARDDEVGLRQWRERLEYELHTNESGYFRQKSAKLKVPINFPDKKVLRYYTHPTVSSAQKLSDLRASIQWECSVDVKGLREFVADAFEWQFLGGAYKYIRGLAPALLVQRLRLRAMETTSYNIDKSAEEERKLIRGIADKPRTHFDSGGMTELRVIYIPAEVASLDLDREESGEYAGIADDESEEDAAGSENDEASHSMSPTKKRGPSKYDPTVPEKIWILETFAKLGVPLTVEIWEAEMRNAKAFASRKARERAAMVPCGLRKGPMDAFTSVSKSGIMRGEDPTLLSSAIESADKTMQRGGPAPTTQAYRTKNIMANTTASMQHRPNVDNTTKSRPTASKGAKKAAPKSRALIHPNSSSQDMTVNPWTLSRRPSDTLDVDVGRTKRYSALGINCSPQSVELEQHTLEPRDGNAFDQPITIDSHLPAEKTRAKALSPGKKMGSANRKLSKRPLSNSSQSKSYSQQASILPKSKGRPRDNNPVSPANSSPVSASSSLPSPSVLMSAPSKKSSAIIRNKKDKSGGSASISVSKAARTRFVIRNSLAGAWKEMEPWEAQPTTPERVVSGVDFVDLTGSS